MNESSEGEGEEGSEPEGDSGDEVIFGNIGEHFVDVRSQIAVQYKINFANSVVRRGFQIFWFISLA